MSDVHQAQGLVSIDLAAHQAAFATHGRGGCGHYHGRDYDQWWLERIAAKTTLDTNGCWVWCGHVGSKGYGETAWHSKSVRIHRRIFEITNQVTLTTAQFICHRCDVRRCWNPEHLFLGDVTVNNRDMLAKGRNYWANTTHCKHGHEFTPDNIYVAPTEPNKRKCKTCMRIRGGSPESLQRARDYQKRLREQAKRERGDHP